MTPLAGLRLTAAQWRAVTEHLTQALPNEACGLLGGLAGQVRVVLPVANRLRSPVAYEMEPAEQIQAMLAIEEAGWEILAIFHSHPAGPARPSPTDIAQAFYPDSLYVICAPAAPQARHVLGESATPGAGGGWQGRAFQIVDGQVAEVSFEIGE